jgi:hypothetical protein
MRRRSAAASESEKIGGPQNVYGPRFRPRAHGVQNNDRAASADLTQKGQPARAAIQKFDSVSPATRVPAQAGEQLQTRAVVTEEEISHSQNKDRLGFS